MLNSRKSFLGLEKFKISSLCDQKFQPSLLEVSESPELAKDSTTDAQPRFLPSFEHSVENLDKANIRSQSERKSTIYLGKCEKCGGGDLWIPGSGRMVILCRQCYLPLSNEKIINVKPLKLYDETQNHNEQLNERAAIAEVDGGLSREEAELLCIHDLNGCYTCHSRRFWIAKESGMAICAQCHPVDTKIVARWIEIP